LFYIFLLTKTKGRRGGVGLELRQQPHSGAASTATEGEEVLQFACLIQALFMYLFLKKVNHMAISGAFDSSKVQRQRKAP
jgi:hypothetical protein